MCIFLSDFVSIENTGSKILIPKLDVAGSIPVACSKSSVKVRGRLRATVVTVIILTILSILVNMAL